LYRNVLYDSIENPGYCQTESSYKFSVTVSTKRTPSESFKLPHRGQIAKPFKNFDF
jgi:hypothetical protein